MCLLYKKMQKRIVTPNEAGQRFSKLLEKMLKNAPKGFIYKMLRKKNITLNGKKADGTEKTAVGDEITLWLSDETIQKFEGVHIIQKTSDYPEIIYEDEHVLLMNKPAGILSQKARPEDISVNEQMLAYLMDTGVITEETLKSFKPSVVNRLDRNTSGLIAAGKTLAGLQALSALFKDRSLHKYYLCLVRGSLSEKRSLEGYLKKDERTNKVRLVGEKTASGDYIHTVYEPVAGNGDMTLLKVLLVTGRTHQIRVHLASDGHPIAGDYKYGDREWNDRLKARYHLKYQLLHAAALKMPKTAGALASLSEKTVTAPLPALFEHILSEEHIKRGM